MGELPAAQRQRLGGGYGLSVYDASVLTSQGRGLGRLFRAGCQGSGDPKAACQLVTNQWLQTPQRTQDRNRPLSRDRGDAGRLAQAA